MDRSPRFPLAPLVVATASLSIPGVLAAQTAAPAWQEAIERGEELPPYLQCVPYAREVSGIAIYGDAHTWWEQAAGRYERGNTPRVGAVMAFVPHRNMELGHVAAVARVIDSRTILLDHANWSPIDGRRGQIERNVKAIDVSPANDWSEVRVWYHPVQGLGATAWPVHGFIYPDAASRRAPRQQWAQASARTMPQPVRSQSALPQPTAPQPTRAEPSRAFLAAFASAPPPQAPRARQAAPRTAYATARPLEPRRVSAEGSDPARRALALYD